MKAENWNGHSIRFVEVEGERWAIADDVAEAVGFTVTTDDLWDLLNTESVAINKSMFIVDLLGVYELLVRNPVGNQNDFMHWISREMKPSRISRILKDSHDKGGLLLSFAVGLMWGLVVLAFFIL